MAASEGTMAVGRPVGRAPDVGDLIAGRYRLEQRVSAAQTWRATDRSTDERVFVKLGAADQQEREVEVLAALDHPGIVRLRDSGIAGGRHFIVVDLVEGIDLETFFARAEPRVGEPALADLMRQLADAVDHVHRRGFLHRDLKPANVLVRADGTPVIVDFGAATPMSGSAATLSESFVSAGYAAPEQYVSDQPEGPWTDIYGLGAIAYRALAGAPPRSAPERVKGGSMPAAAARAGTAAGPLHRAVDRALELEPAARPQTVEAWIASLGAEAGEPLAAPGDASPATLDDLPPTIRVRRVTWAKLARASAPATPPTRSRRRRAGLATALTLLLALGAGVAAAAWYGRPFFDRYVKIDWVVDPAGGGDAASIADAIARAGDGAVVDIQPGTYAESLVIERPIHLRPADPASPPLIAPEEGPCVRASSAGGSVSGLRFTGPEPDDPAATPAPCLLVAAGSLRLEGNRIAGGSGPAIAITAGSEPVVVANAIEERPGPGIVVAAGALGQISENTINGAGGPAMIVRSGAAPLIVDNRIAGSGAVVFAEGATGTFEGNRILSSPGSAIEVRTGADPTIVDNTIEEAGGAGVFVYDHGRGRFERNFIVGSALSGVVVAAGADVRLDDNAIRDSAEHGVLIVEGGRAALSGNAIEDNAGHGIAIAGDAEAELEGNELSGNTEPQVLDGRAP